MSSVAVLPPSPAIAGRNVSALRLQLESSLQEDLAATLLLRERAAPLTVPTGIAPLDELTGGLPRGALSEFAGLSSSGRTGAMLAALARSTRRQEICALVDATDSFDPASAAAAGVILDRLLWVRCNPERQSGRSRDGRIRHPGKSTFAFSDVLEQVLKVTDLLLQAGGFGMVALDIGDIPSDSVRRIPLTSWFRFRRAVEPTSTVLLLIEQEACAKTCASLVLDLHSHSVCTSHSATGEVSTKMLPRLHNQQPATSVVSHASLLRGMRFHAEIARCWKQRKPQQSVGARFELRTAGNQPSAQTA